MTPYTKKIVELHKIHKAIEDKDCCNDGGGSSDDSSKEITIDDVVKFIHDNTENPRVDIPTKYDDIKHVSEELDFGTNLLRGTEQEINDFYNSNVGININGYLLASTNYNIISVSKNR